MQRMAHHRWDKKTGDRVRQAQDVVNGMVVPGVDALDDHIVKIQRARHARLIGCDSPPPVVQRLLNPPVPEAPPLDALGEFLAAMRQRAEDEALAASPPKPAVAPKATKMVFRGNANGPGLPTKMGLYYACP